MHPQNIQKFDETVAIMLAKLYDNFPTPQSIVVDAYGVDVQILYQVDGSEIYKQEKMKANAVINAVRWLADEDYLRFDSQSSEGDRIRGAVLTQKGLSLLNAIPASLSQTRGARLSSAIKSGAKEVAKEVLRQVLEEGAKWITGR